MLFKMSFHGGILVLLVIIARALAINKLPKRLFVLLWGIVLLRLLIPIDLPLPYGITSPVVKLAGSEVNNPAASTGASILQRCRAAGYVTLAAFAKWMLTHPLGSLLAGIKLLVSDRISTPMAFGIFSPRIVLSKIFKPMNDMQLKYVLTHELVHIKRADNLWKIVMLSALCIHWFNPLVWVMYFLFNRDIELSCDEKVLSLLGINVKNE